MDKNIRVRKGTQYSDSEYSYGKDRSRLFGWQESRLTNFLDTRLGGKKTGTLNVSTEPKAGSMEVRLKLDEENQDRFTVTSPRALRGQAFCTKGVQTYFGKAVAQQKRLKLYVKL